MVKLPRLVDARCDSPERTHGRRLMAECCPNLAQKANDGSLAVSAGDSGDGLGLPQVEAGRHQREAAPRIFVENQRHAIERATIEALRPCRARRGENGRGAAPHRFVNIHTPVRTAAGERREQETALHLPRVGSESGDVDVGVFYEVQVGSGSRN